MEQALEELREPLVLLPVVAHKPQGSTELGSRVAVEGSRTQGLTPPLGAAAAVGITATAGLVPREAGGLCSAVEVAVQVGVLPVQTHR